ncbi:sensor histidine kinase [Allocoleopsis franciscana]|uniref:histidine kinase n=1 Tax=Allocoleopsis franciscana PCC 7113 TaxID=1173027 RepID=K9WCV8_9CYAN|nr:histidine kinase [Allocoleopsis franciscana PCC 7113]
MVQKWLLPSISEVLAHKEQIGLDANVAPENGRVPGMCNTHPGTNRRGERGRALAQQEVAAAKAQREWQSAIATLEPLLLQTLAPSGSDGDDCDPLSLQGLVLAGPVPVLSHPELLGRFKTGIFTSDTYKALAWMPFQLPPATTEPCQLADNTAYELPLVPADPLASEQFCLVFTPHFSLVMVVGEDLAGTPAFQFSFDPEDIQQAWTALRLRMLLTTPHQLSQLESLIEQFAPKPPDYRIVMNFGRQLLQNLPEPPETEKVQTIPITSTDSNVQVEPFQPQDDTFQSNRRWEPIMKKEERGVSKISNPHEITADVELLKALTHEIRTPLTTIRTLTKLLLKRRDLAPEVIRRLEIIDHECTEQINRMELIFRAAELETTTVKQVSVNLTSMSLAQVFEHSIPRWQKQAARRNLTLDVVLPQKLPTVVSNPAMLDQVLTGLVENFTRSLPAGGHIQVQVTPAGDQLKLQFQSQPDPESNDNSNNSANFSCSTLKSLGQLLMFQPETGSLSLNLSVTKHLFQALGGKLIVRQRPQEGEVMTIFLPLEVTDTHLCNQKEILA